MDAFRGLIDIGAFDLALPLIVRGIEISTASLAAPPAGVFAGPAVGSRELRVQTPIMVGRDVRLVQLWLSRPGVGFNTGADGKFGQVSAATARQLQQSRGLPQTGVVNAATLAALRP